MYARPFLSPRFFFCIPPFLDSFVSLTPLRQGLRLPLSFLDYQFVYSNLFFFVFFALLSSNLLPLIRLFAVCCARCTLFIASTCLVPQIQQPCSPRFTIHSISYITRHFATLFFSRPLISHPWLQSQAPLPGLGPNFFFLVSLITLQLSSMFFGHLV